MPAFDTNPKKSANPWAWMWLAYTGFLFVVPLMEPSLDLWLGTIAALAAYRPAQPGEAISSPHPADLPPCPGTVPPLAGRDLAR